METRILWISRLAKDISRDEKCRGDARRTSLAHANLGSRRCTADGPNEGCIPSRLFARWQICQWTLGAATAWKDPPSIRRLPLASSATRRSFSRASRDTLHRSQGNVKARARISRDGDVGRSTLYRKILIEG